jgi:hypothetical protein
MERQAIFYALAGLVKKPMPNKIIPSIFDKRVVMAVSSTIRDSK